MSEEIYLDYAAITPVSQDVLNLQSDLLKTDWYNPASLYEKSLQTKSKLEKSKRGIAALLGVQPGELVFTSGATEANNLAVRGVLGVYPGSKVCISAAEHDSVANVPAEDQLVECAIGTNGLLDLTELKAKLTDEVCLVSLILVNNETGVCQKISDVRSVIDDIILDRKSRALKRPLYLHMDCSQALLSFQLFPKNLGIDLATLNSSKIYGPRRTGLLYVNSAIKLQPQLKGGGQQRGLRPGTEALDSIAAFELALRKATTRHQNNVEKLTKLRDAFEISLQDMGAEIVAQKSPRSPHITCALFPKVDNETLAMQLSNKGIYVGLGSACHAAKGIPSRALAAMGYSDEQMNSSIRFSYGLQTKSDQLDRVSLTLKELLS